MNLERKIALVTVKSISMSSLRDDWVVSAKEFSDTIIIFIVMNRL